MIYRKQEKGQERTRKEKENDKSLAEKVKESAKMTAGIIWKCGTNHLGKSVLDAMKEDQMKKFIAEKQKIEKKEKVNFQIKSEYDSLIADGKNNHSIQPKGIHL